MQIQVLSINQAFRKFYCKTLASGFIKYYDAYLGSCGLLSKCLSLIPLCRNRLPPHSLCTNKQTNKKTFFNNLATSGLIFTLPRSNHQVSALSSKNFSPFECGEFGVQSNMSPSFSLITFCLKTYWHFKEKFHFQPLLGAKGLTLYSLISRCTFSILFSLHFIRC